MCHPGSDVHIYIQSILSHDHNTGGTATCPVYEIDSGSVIILEIQYL